MSSLKQFKLGVPGALGALSKAGLKHHVQGGASIMLSEFEAARTVGVRAIGSWTVSSETFLKHSKTPAATPFDQFTCRAQFKICLEMICTKLEVNWAKSLG